MRAFHRGGLIRATRDGLRAIGAFLQPHLGVLAAILTILGVAALVGHVREGLLGSLVVGVAGAELNGSDFYRQLRAWALLDANGGLKCMAGLSGLFGKLVLRVDEQFTIAGIGNGADATDDTAYTKLLPANLLAKNGDELLVEAEVLSAGNGNNKTAKIILGGTTLLTTGVLTSNAKNIQLRLRIVRTAAATQLWFATVTVDGVATTLTKGTAAEDLTTGLNLKLTLASPTTGAASDLLAFRWAVDLASLVS